MNCFKHIIVIIFVLGMVRPMMADTTYVDPGASFAGDGSFSRPYSSWSYVQWRPGNTYLQKRGTVTNETVSIGASGTKDAYVVVGAYGEGERPRIETHEKIAIKISDKSYVHIKDFKIKTTGQTRYYYTSGIYGHNGEYNVIENVDIGPAAAHGIYLQNHHNLHVKNCLFYNTGTKDEWDSCDNIHLENCHEYLVEYCVSYNALQGAVYDASDGGSGYTTGTWRYNIGYRTPDSNTDHSNWSIYKLSGHHEKSRVSLLYNIAYGSFNGPAYALQEELVSTVIGNVAYDCVAGFQQSPDTNIIKNNIVMNCGNVIYFQENKMPSQMDNNLYFNNNRFGFIQGSTVFQTLADFQSFSGLDQHSMVQDPMFTDAANHDFTLQNNSPAIDAGENLGSSYDSALYAFSEWTDNVILVNQNDHGSGWEIGPFVFKPVVYIDPSLATNGIGSINKPFNSWNHVEWRAGYTYLQKRGTTWDASITVEASGTKRNPITIGAYGEGDNPRVITSENSAFIIQSAAYINLEDFDIETHGSSYAHGIQAHNAFGIKLMNVRTDSTVGHGAYFLKTDSLSIQNCHFESAGYGMENKSYDNIHLDTCQWFTISATLSRNNKDGSGIEIIDGKGSVLYNKLDNTGNQVSAGSLISTENEAEVVLAYNILANATDTSAIVMNSKGSVFNNTIFNCKTGIHNNNANNEIKNNIFSVNQTALNIKTLPEFSDYNLFYANATDVFDSPNQMSLQEWKNAGSNNYDQHSLNADPKFTDTLNLDFTLLSGSHAVDNGSPTADSLREGLKSNTVIPDTLVTVDQNNYGSGWEIGAYVFINRYDLTINAENGSVVPSDSTYYERTEVELSAIPDENYVFTGWSGDISGTTNPITISMDSSITVTANFIQGFNLVTHASNGTVTPAEGTFLDGEEVTLTATPDSDYHFEKWSGDVESTENPVTFVMNGDKEITAHFYKTYQLNITAENGTVAPESGEYKADTQLVLMAYPDEGYKFVAWNGTVSGIVNPLTITLNRDMDIIAVFSALPEYTLTVEAQNGSVTPGSGTYFEGDTVSLTAHADSGYVFTNWTGDVQDTSTTIEIIMNRNYTIEANFIKVTSVWTDIHGNSPEVYPNPVYDKLHIEVSPRTDIHETYQLLLYDVLGKIKFMRNVSGSSVIDVSRLNKGIYILQLKKEDENLMHKMIIKE